MDLKYSMSLTRFVIRYNRPRITTLLRLLLWNQAETRLVSRNAAKGLLNRHTTLYLDELLNLERKGQLTVMQFTTENAMVRFFNGRNTIIAYDHLPILSFIRSGKIDVLSAGLQESTVRLNDYNIVISGPAGLLPELIQEMLSDFYYQDVNVLNDVVVDIGGYMGDSAALFVSQGAKAVYVFEPSSEALRYARRNLSGYSNVYLFDYGLGCGDRDARLSGYGSRKKLVTSEGMEIIHVRDVNITLKTILGREGEIGLLKIDCEGCEHELLQCLNEQLLEKIRRVQVEIHGENHNLALAKLTNKGYAIKSMKILPWDPKIAIYTLEHNPTSFA